MENLFIKLFGFLLIILSINIRPQNLVQADFNSDIIPSVMGSGSSTRLAVVFRATVQNLTPNTLYRYFNQGAIFTDLGGTNPGAGNPLLINPDSSNFIYTTGPSLSSDGNYSVFRTNSSGNFTGWFALANTGNARFTSGNYIIPTVVVGDSTGLLLYRRALNDSILVLSFGTSNITTNGTGIWGRSFGSDRNFVLLYDNINGTGRPVSLTYLENDGTTIANSVQFYADSVNTFNGRWGTIVPNLNSNGIRRIEERSLSTGSILAFNTSSNGIWTSGANTVNPTGGTTPIIIDSSDAPLPVELISFTAEVNNNCVKLNWTTETETNNLGFTIERKSNGDWREIGFVKGNGFSTSLKSYSFTDKNIKNGEYSYRLKQNDFDGTFEYSNLVNVVVMSLTNFELSQNYPNPFNPNTVISYQLPVSGNVTLKVYDVLGNEIVTLVNEEKPAGSYGVEFDGSNLSSGVYFYQLRATDYLQTKKMILLR